MTATAILRFHYFLGYFFHVSLHIDKCICKTASLSKTHGFWKIFSVFVDGFLFDFRSYQQSFFYDADPLRSLFFGDFCTIEVSEIHWKGATHMTADKLIIQQKKQIDELTAQLHSLQMSFDILGKTY